LGTPPSSFYGAIFAAIGTIARFALVPSRDNE
jgi:hypothetical protein